MASNVVLKNGPGLPGGVPTRKQPPGRDTLMDHAQAARFLAITDVELALLVKRGFIPHLCYGSGLVRFRLTDVKEFRALSYWSAGKAHADGSRKRKPDPNSCRVLYSPIIGPAQAAQLLGITETQLERIRGEGNIAHLHYGLGIVRYCQGDVRAFLDRSERKVVARRRPKPQVPTATYVAVVPKSPITPLSSPLVPMQVRRAQPMVAATRPDAAQDAAIPAPATPPVAPSPEASDRDVAKASSEVDEDAPSPGRESEAQGASYRPLIRQDLAQGPDLDKEVEV